MNTVRSVASNVEDAVSVTEVPMSEHQFRATPTFYKFALILNAMLVVLGLLFTPMAQLSVASTLLGALFIYTRLYAGYRIRPATVWVTLVASLLSAICTSLAAYYSTLYVASEEGRTAALVWGVFQWLFSLTYLGVSSVVFSILGKPTQGQAAPINIVDVPVEPEQPKDQKPSDVPVYPVDIPQSGGAVVV